jgi:PAS domain S-box-containing protein
VARARTSRVTKRMGGQGPPTDDELHGHLRDRAAVVQERLREKRGTKLTVRQRWLNTILEQLPFGVIIVPAAPGTVVFCNASAARTWPGVLRPPATLKDVVPCRLIRTDGRPYTERESPWAQALARDTVVAEEVQFLANNGTRTVMDVRCTPVRDRESVSAVVVILQDVSERQRVERALQASQAQYESLYQDAPDMFASLTVDTEHIAQCNQTLERATGYSRNELLGRPVRDLHHPSCWPDLAAALELVRKSGRVRDAELQLQRKNGETIDVSLGVAAIRDERGTLYYRSTWRDITARKRAQAIARQKQAELERSRLDLQALAGRLFTAQEDERRRISRELHDDLNQRLAILALEIEGLYQRLPRSREVTVERLRALHDGVVELSDAVHSLAYRLHASVLDDLGLPAALESLLGDYTQREAVEVEFNQERLLDPLPPEVASCLYRVAQEALRNVVRHAHAKRVTLSLGPSGTGISMVIADDGVGFDVPSTQHVGSSLGIVGMQERVRLVDGRLTLESRPGDGTHVDVWVPVPRQEEHAPSGSVGG